MRKTLSLIAAAGMAAFALPAAAEQAGRSGQALNVYCNTVPEMGTARSDSVDNWVKICTVWLNAKAGLAEKPKKGKEKVEEEDVPPPPPKPAAKEKEKEKEAPAKDKR
ncbi:MAG: hypothetical protein H7841_08660 [Magnetospirillum sp. WYHS-4]